MKRLQLKRIKFSREADSWLRTLKSRTGVTPNLLCRLALSVSLAETGGLKVDGIDEDSDREINRATLLGDFDLLAACLLTQWRAENVAFANVELEDLLRAHVHRGILLLSQRLRAPADLATVIG